MIKIECEDIIKKIKELTQKNKLEWKRIKGNVDIYSRENFMLRNYIEENTEYGYEQRKNNSARALDLMESFMTSIEDGMIFLIKKVANGKSIFYLAIQSNKESEILDLNINGEYQESMLTIKYLILNNIDRTESFIDKIMKM